MEMRPTLWTFVSLVLSCPESPDVEKKSKKSLCGHLEGWTTRSEVPPPGSALWGTALSALKTGSGSISAGRQPRAVSPQWAPPSYSVHRNMHQSQSVKGNKLKTKTCMSP